MYINILFIIYLYTFMENVNIDDPIKLPYVESVKKVVSDLGNQISELQKKLSISKDEGEKYEINREIESLYNLIVNMNDFISTVIKSTATE